MAYKYNFVCDELLERAKPHDHAYAMRAARVLPENGIELIDELTQLTYDELLKLDGVGPKLAMFIEDTLDIRLKRTKRRSKKEDRKIRNSHILNDRERGLTYKQLSQKYRLSIQQCKNICDTKGLGYTRTKDVDAALQAIDMLGLSCSPNKIVHLIYRNRLQKVPYDTLSESSLYELRNVGVKMAKAILITLELMARQDD